MSATEHKGEEPNKKQKTNCMYSFLAGAKDEASLAPRMRPVDDNGSLVHINKSLFKLTVAAESLRFIAYLFFWAMVLLAIAITRLIVVDRLAAGPKVDGDSCGPFNQENPGLGQGFDFYTENHLLQQSGYSNICTYWDYSPAREISAMFYPLLEYSLVLYLVMNFITVALSYQRGESSKWFWTLTKIFFPFQLISTAWFRMCFVVLSYEDIAGHTAGFMGLIILLMLLAIQNCIYGLDCQVSYKFLGGLKGTRYAVIIYLISNLIISGCKLSSVYHVVRTGEVAPWVTQKAGPIYVIKIVDSIWLGYNGVLPLFIAFFRARMERGIDITIDMKPQKYFERNADDDTPPHNGGSFQDDDDSGGSRSRSVVDLGL